MDKLSYVGAHGMCPLGVEYVAQKVYVCRGVLLDARRSYCPASERWHETFASQEAVSNNSLLCRLGKLAAKARGTSAGPKKFAGMSLVNSLLISEKTGNIR